MNTVSWLAIAAKLRKAAIPAQAEADLLHNLARHCDRQAADAAEKQAVR